MSITEMLFRNRQIPRDIHACNPYRGRNNVLTFALRLQREGLELEARPLAECLMRLQLARELRRLDKEGWTT